MLKWDFVCVDFSLILGVLDSFDCFLAGWCCGGIVCHATATPASWTKLEPFRDNFGFRFFGSILRFPGSCLYPSLDESRFTLCEILFRDFSGFTEYNDIVEFHRLLALARCVVPDAVCRESERNDRFA